VARNHELCRAVGVYARALLAFQRQRAQQRGIRDGRATVEDPRDIREVSREVGTRPPRWLPSPRHFVEGRQSNSC
jgi:hypothetical protein